MKMKYNYQCIWRGILACWIICILCAAKPENGQELQSTRITVNFKQTSLKTVLRKISRITGFDFAYSTNNLPVDEKVDLKTDNEGLDTALLTILSPLELTYRVEGQLIIIEKRAVRPQASAAIVERDLKGKIKDEKGSGIPGVSILVKNTTVGTVTDVDGNFSLKIPDDDPVLVISSIGYVTSEVPVGNRSVLDFSLTVDTKQLSELVIIGYGEQSKKTITGSIASVDIKSTENVPAVGSDQLLQGRISGVEVRTNSGEPGSGIVVRVRGTSSITGSSDPLYVVDGIPVQSNSLSDSRILGSRPTNPMADINPADIASIEVLKDASSTAIYGARAANGVVLITTKRGSSGDKVKISFDAYAGFQKPWKKLASVDGPTYEMLINEASVNNGGQPVYANPDAAITNNWQDYIWNTGTMQNYNLSFQGGNDKVQYFLSGSRTSQEGILKGADFHRNSIRANLDFNATKKLKIGSSLLFSGSDRNRIFDGGVIGAVVTAKVYPPNQPLYQPDGSLTRLNSYENPYLVISEADNKMFNNRFLGNVSAKYEFFDGFSFQTNLSIDYGVVRERQYYSTLLITGAANNGLARASSVEDKNWINENLLSYAASRGNHNFSALAGFSFQESERPRIYAEGKQFPSDQFREISSAAVQLSATENTSSGLSSVFGRFVYDYNRKYMATFTIRRDGSSRFGSDHKWGTFPSVALGWNVSDEAFLADNKTVSALKLRASYGLTGNQNGIGDYQSLDLWAGGENYVDYAGTKPIQLGNPNLKWETTYQLDLGVDVGLFNNKVNLVVDYYDKITRDLLLAVPIPATSGFQTLVQNYGKVGNKGIEIGISADAVKKENFSWNINFNIAGNKNKVLKIAAPFNTGNLQIFRVQEGSPLYSFYMHEQLGVDPQTGSPIWNVLEPDRPFNASLDRKIVGDANPDFFGGLTNTLTYKGFDLMAFLQYSYGNQMFNQTGMYQQHGGTTRENFLATQLGRWQKPGDVTMVPKMTNANYATSLRPSRFIEDASYLRVKNVSVGYNFPRKMIRAARIQNLRVYVAAQNLLTFTKYSGLDPELSGNQTVTLAQGVDLNTTPQPRVFMAGFNVSF